MAVALRRIVFLLAAAALAVALLPRATAPAEARTRTACSLPGSKTVDRVGPVRLLRKDGIHYACHDRTDRPFALHRTRVVLGKTELWGVSSFRVAGPFVGYVLSYADNDSEFARVRVMDARTGRLVRSVLQGRRVGNSVVTVRDLELKSPGAVAWTTQETTGCGARVCAVDTCAVRSADGPRRYSATELDSDRCFTAGINPDSLTLTGSTLTWVRLGQAVSATLGD